jgi:hypothetical protein
MASKIHNFLLTPLIPGKDRNVKNMTYLILGVVLLAAVPPYQSAAAQTAGSTDSCEAALGALAAEWRAIAFEPPSKPAQAIVTGQNGYVTTGGQYNSMTSHIRAAHVACQQGDGADAMRHIAAVRETIDGAARRQD